jgi:ABC-type dipeptide/oligopeptide/nickel transport system ATPase component
MIFQEPMTSLNPSYTIGEQISRGAGAPSRPLEAQGAREGDRALKRAGIPSPVERIDDYPHKLSGGHAPARHDRDRARLRSELLIADEPTTRST